MNAAKLRKLKGSTLERATRVKALDEFGQACDAKLKPMKFGRRYSELARKRLRYVYGQEDEAP